MSHKDDSEPKETQFEPQAKGEYRIEHVRDFLKEEPDRILELYAACPECGGKALEALTWKSRGLDDVTVGCWECGWLIEPEESNVKGLPPVGSEDW